MTDFSEKYQYLLKELERLTKELDALKAAISPSVERRAGSPFGKREEEATQAMELEKMLAMQKHLIDSLAKVKHALEKYESGTYGICDQCGKQIQSGRLEALPYTALCLECKSKQTKNTRGGTAR